jgi:hypothetical protein
VIHAAHQLRLTLCWLFVQVLVAIVSLLLLARVIEPVYGSTEFLKYILAVDLCSSLGTFVMAYIIFMTAPQLAKGKTL